MENKVTKINPHKMSQSEISDYIEHLPEEILENLTFSMPWQYDSENESYRDADGFTTTPEGNINYTREVLQKECWNKFNVNPQVNTAIRGLTGRICGYGYEVTSGYYEIQRVIDEITYDPRNRLYNYWNKWVSLSNIEGEMFLCLSCHDDGFIEVDWFDPATIKGGGYDDCGIIFHPTKTTLPLFYNIVTQDSHGIEKKLQIPSIYIARYPDLLNVIKSDYNFTPSYQVKSRKKIFSKFGGYYQFIVSWDKGFMTRRNVSYLRTTLEWLNHYENLKKYEIDHKKASGSYLWVFKVDDARTFKQWLSLSDEDKRKTAIGSKLTPGGRIILPPGMDVKCVNPSLTAIKDQDTDIFHMATSGLNEPEDITTGKASSPYASVKASRGPMSDRVSDEIEYHDNFVKYDFWGSLFFLKSAISNFPTYFKRKEAIEFRNQEPVFENVKRRPEELIDITHPVSEMIDMESRARAMLGVKHGPISETIGIPASDVAKRMGFSGYQRLRLRKATEDELLPELVFALDAESLQEKTQTEPARPPEKSPKKKVAKEKEI
jgi:hypothetical protein